MSVSRAFCGKCGARRASDEDPFCTACGAPFAQAGAHAASEARKPDVEPSEHALTFISRSRNLGNVLWGVFWGVFVHIAIFFMLFNMKKGSKREDRVFGYWIGLGGSVVAATALAVVLVLARSSRGVTNPTHTAPAMQVTIGKLAPGFCYSAPALPVPAHDPNYLDDLFYTYSPQEKGPYYSANTGLWWEECSTNGSNYTCLHANDISLEIKVESRWCAEAAGPTPNRLSFFGRSSWWREHWWNMGLAFGALILGVAVVHRFFRGLTGHLAD